MQFEKQLRGFLDTVQDDSRISPGHISLYLALLHLWADGDFATPLSFSRRPVMFLSKISARTTYQKLINDLYDYGYISYASSFNRYQSNLVWLMPL